MTIAVSSSKMSIEREPKVSPLLISLRTADSRLNTLSLEVLESVSHYTADKRDTVLRRYSMIKEILLKKPISTLLELYLPTKNYNRTQKLLNELSVPLHGNYVCQLNCRRLLRENHEKVFAEFMTKTKCDTLPKIDLGESGEFWIDVPVVIQGFNGKHYLVINPARKMVKLLDEGHLEIAVKVASTDLLHVLTIMDENVIDYGVIRSIVADFRLHNGTRTAVA